MGKLLDFLRIYSAEQEKEKFFIMQQAIIVKSHNFINRRFTLENSSAEVKQLAFMLGKDILTAKKAFWQEEIFGCRAPSWQHLLAGGLGDNG